MPFIPYVFLRDWPDFCAPKAMPVRYLGMSQNTSATPSTPRVPHAAQGVDVNFCRNPKCKNFGVPIPQGVQRGPGASNPYTVVSNGKNIPAARCNACGEHITLKSNSLQVLLFYLKLHK